MTVLIPVNGRNERMGSLFKTPKHLLLYKGIPAIENTLNYLGGMETHILTNDDYIGDLMKYHDEDIKVHNIGYTESQVETIRQFDPKNDIDVMIVDCDGIPIRLYHPAVNMVYVFENKLQDKQYSNFSVQGVLVKSCNEKETVCQYAGAGIYYFRSFFTFVKHSKGCTSISQVISNMIKEEDVWFDADNEIFRFGTLKDITG